MSRLRHPLIVTALIAVSVALVALAHAPSWAARSVAADLHQRIQAADEAVAPSLVESLAALDAAALPHLLELLDDSRRSVRHATRRALFQRLETWSEQRTAASQRNIEQLASLLVTHELPREFHSRAIVKVLALKLLRCSEVVSNERRAEFLTQCSTILERTLADTASAPAPQEATQSPGASAAVDEMEGATAFLPLEPFSPLSDEVDVTEPSPGDETNTRPQPPARIEAHRPRPIAELQNASAGRIDEAALRALPTRSLIRHLHDLPAVAERAKAELQRRGFDDQALEVAYQLDHPDRKMRRQLAESLPRTVGIQAAPWLWELAEDEDEEVRRTARNILATSSNPQTRARVSRLPGLR